MGNEIDLNSYAEIADIVIERTEVAQLRNTREHRLSADSERELGKLGCVNELNEYPDGRTPEYMQYLLRGDSTRVD
jgi:hypothetical protein